MKEEGYRGRIVGQNKMRFATPSNSKYAPRYRAIFTTLLFVLCGLFFFYQLVPSFTHTTDRVVASLTSHLRTQPPGSDLCTSQVGNAQCCSLYLDAAPCVDECRNQHVDRETLSLTLEYDKCASECLAQYNAVCDTNTFTEPER